MKPRAKQPVPARAPDKAAAFRLQAISLTGNTVMSTSELAPLYAEFLNQNVSLDDLTSITDAITERYRAAGYFLSRAYVPAQDVVGGGIEIRIAEGRIAEITLSSDPAIAARLTPFAEAIRAEQPLRLATLERQLLLITQLGGMRVNDPTIDEIGEFSGRFRLTVETAFNQFGGFVSANTYGTRDVGRLQAQAGVSLNSPLGLRDTLSASIGGVPQDPREWTYGALSYDVMPVPGFWLGAHAAYGELQPGGTDRLLSASEAYWDASLNVGYVPVLARDRLWRIDMRLSAGDANGDDVTGPNKRDRTRAIGVSTTLFHTFPGNGAITVYADLEQGINGLGASHAGDPLLSRSDAEADFTRLSGGLDWTQPLIGPLSIAVSGAAQTTSAPLLSSREFYLGGARFGRGYEPGALSGDRGAAASGELRYTRSADLGWLTGIQLYGYYDIGSVWEKGASGRVSLASAGGGLRLFYGDQLEIGAEIGVPLTYSEYVDGSHPVRANLFMAKSF